MHRTSQVTQCDRHSTHGIWGAGHPPPQVMPAAPAPHTPPPKASHLDTHDSTVGHALTLTNTNLLLDIFKPRLVLLLWQPPQTHCHSNLTSAFQAPNPGGLQGPDLRPEEGAATPSPPSSLPPQYLHARAFWGAASLGWVGAGAKHTSPLDRAEARTPLHALFPSAPPERYGGAPGAKVSLPPNTHKPGFASWF